MIVLKCDGSLLAKQPVTSRYVSTAVRNDLKPALCISLQVHLFEISARSCQIDVALSNGVGFQPIRIVVL